MRKEDLSRLGKEKADVSAVENLDQQISRVKEDLRRVDAWKETADQDMARVKREVAESGRRSGRAELLARRPHGRLRRLSAELENVGERRGSLRLF